MAQWQHFLNRLQQEIEYQLRNNNSRKEQGIVLLKIEVLAGIDEPVLWTVEGKKVEPGGKAKSLLELC